MRTRGFTLIEVMIVLAVAVVLLSLGLPSFHAQLQRHRLKAAAEGLALQMSEAREEAVRRGRPLYWVARPGVDWCTAAATDEGCDCRLQQPCVLKAERAARVRGVELVAAGGAAFDPASGVRTGEGYALVQSPGGDRLRVELSTMGRARVCAPDGTFPRVTAC